MLARRGVREILQSQGIPLDLVDAVLAQPK
jgi:hypothetical protein